MRFTKNRAKELKEFLRKGYIHDAELEEARYEKKEGCLKILVFNRILNIRANFIFRDIVVTLAIRGNYFGNNLTINSLTVEDDFTYLQKYISKCNEEMDNSLYLLFELFSGDELHVVSKEVVIEVDQAGGSTGDGSVC